jgi:hypothetical protein
LIAHYSDHLSSFGEIREGVDKFAHNIRFDQQGLELVARRTFHHFHADFHVVRARGTEKHAVFEVWVDFLQNHHKKQHLLSVSMGLLKAADINSIFLFLDTQRFIHYRHMVAVLRKKTI